MATRTSSDRARAARRGPRPRRADRRLRQVDLAFDDKVILRDVSFTLQTGHTKIFLGASGAGKSTILQADPRAC